MPSAHILQLSRKIHQNHLTSNTDIDSHFRLDIQFKILPSTHLCHKTHQKELLSDAKEQLRSLLPIFSPTIREFVCDLYEDPILWNSVFTPNDIILLCYCYFNMNIATQHIDQWKYESRVKSFQSEHTPWPLTNHLSAENMAEYGFFRREPFEKQQTSCFVCGCVLSGWIATDNVSDGHSQFRPQCPFMWIMIFLKRTLFTNFQDRYRDRNVNDNPREYASLESHRRLLTDQVPHRLEKLFNWYESLDRSSEELLSKEMECVVSVRDVFQYNKMDILFTLCKKMFRYWNTQKCIVTQRDLLIDVKHLFTNGQTLIKDILQNRRNSSHLPYIPGGMPSDCQFVEPPSDGGLSLISQLSRIIQSQNISNREFSSNHSAMTQTSIHPAYPSHNVGVLSNTVNTRSNIALISNNSLSRNVGQRMGSIDFELSESRSEIDLPQNVVRALSNRICVQCMRRSAIYLLMPCRHLPLCNECGLNTRSVTCCPACKSPVTDVIRVFTT